MRKRAGGEALITRILDLGRGWHLCTGEQGRPWPEYPSGTVARLRLGCLRSWEWLRLVENAFDDPIYRPQEHSPRAAHWWHDQ
jgi:hypothetical protein